MGDKFPQDIIWQNLPWHKLHWKNSYLLLLTLKNTWACFNIPTVCPGIGISILKIRWFHIDNKNTYNGNRINSETNLKTSKKFLSAFTMLSFLCPGLPLVLIWLVPFNPFPTVSQHGSPRRVDFRLLPWQHTSLTLRCRDNMVTIFQTTFSNAFSWKLLYFDENLSAIYYPGPYKKYSSIGSDNGLYASFGINGLMDLCRGRWALHLVKPRMFSYWIKKQWQWYLCRYISCQYLFKWNHLYYLISLSHLHTYWGG